MRRWILAVALASLVPAAGMASRSRTRKSAPTERSARALAPSARSAAVSPLGPKEEVADAARELFRSLLAGDAQAVTDRSALPFVLEDRTFRDAEGLLEEWVRQLGGRRTDLLVLHGIEVLTPEEMEAKFGLPPARLGSFPWRTRGSLIAIGNLSGRAAVAVFRAAKPGDWRLIAYHD
jgi:hypothetical protein